MRDLFLIERNDSQRKILSGLFFFLGSADDEDLHQVELFFSHNIFSPAFVSCRHKLCSPPAGHCSDAEELLCGRYTCV